MPNVVVTNKNDEAYSRKFSGEPYEFKPGVPVTITDVAAAYLFGYGRDEAVRRKILVRNGWQQNGIDGDPFGPVHAMKRLQNFVFKAAPDDPVRPKPEKKLAPATKAAREAGGINAMSPGVDAGGNKITVRETLHLPGKTGPNSPARQPPA